MTCNFWGPAREHFWHVCLCNFTFTFFEQHSPSWGATKTRSHEPLPRPSRPSLLMGFNNRINRPVDGRLLNQLKTHLVQPSKTYATTIQPTDRPSFHFSASLVELYGVQLPLSIVAYLGNWKYGIIGRPSWEELSARIRKNQHCLQRSLNENVFSSFFFACLHLNYPHLLQHKVSDGRMVGHVQLPVPASGPRHDRPSNESKFPSKPIRSTHRTPPTPFPTQFQNRIPLEILVQHIFVSG